MDLEGNFTVTLDVPFVGDFADNNDEEDDDDENDDDNDSSFLQESLESKARNLDVTLNEERSDEHISLEEGVCLGGLGR